MSIRKINFSNLTLYTQPIIYHRHQKPYHIQKISIKTENICLVVACSSFKEFQECLLMEGKRCMKFYHKLQHVKPQQTAIAGGNFLMFNYGIHLGYSFFHWKDVAVAWTDKITDSFIALVVVMFFIGNIVGFSIAPTSLKLFSKKSIYVSK